MGVHHWLWQGHLTGVLPCWLPFFTVLLANLHLNWPLLLWVLLLCLLHVKKSQKPQRKCKYPLMALIQMDAPMTIAPPVPVVWVFVSEKHRGHHNNTAKLCMQTSPIDVLKSTASCYDNWVSSFRDIELLSLNVSVKTLWGHKAGFKTKDVGGVIIDSVGHHFSAHLLNISLYICWRMVFDGIAFSGGVS